MTRCWFAAATTVTLGFMTAYLVISRRRTETYAAFDVDAVLPAETARIRELYADGVVRAIWLRGDCAGAAFLVEADDLAAAQAVVDALPMATRGMSDFSVIPLRPYSGFAA